MLLYIPHHTVTNANNKPCYLILVENEADKMLYKGYIQERTALYDLMITSLEENNIPNEPKQIKEFLLNIRKTFPFYYAVFDTFYQNQKKQPYTNFLNLTYFVYGPPETTMNDLTTKANLTILPKEIEDSSEIVFPINAL